jgi:hypothetical protein
MTLLGRNSQTFQPIIDLFFSSSATKSCDHIVSDIKTFQDPPVDMVESAITFCDKADAKAKADEVREIIQK